MCNVSGTTQTQLYCPFRNLREVSRKTNWVSWFLQLLASSIDGRLSQRNLHSVFWLNQRRRWRWFRKKTSRNVLFLRNWSGWEIRGTSADRRGGNSGRQDPLKWILEIQPELVFDNVSQWTDSEVNGFSQHSQQLILILRQRTVLVISQEVQNDWKHRRVPIDEELSVLQHPFLPIQIRLLSTANHCLRHHSAHHSGGGVNDVGNGPAVRQTVAYVIKRVRAIWGCRCKCDIGWTWWQIADCEALLSSEMRSLWRGKSQSSGFSYGLVELDSRSFQKNF